MSGPATSPDSFTPEQRRAIVVDEGAVLVTAAAGSGKTRVLTERVLQLITREADRCDIDELLIVTFTRAAAAEMRDRIERRLAERVTSATGAERDALERQLRLVDRASIDTISAFCSQLVRQNFQAVDVDPDFRILDEDEARLLQLELIEQVIGDRFAAGDRRLDELLAVHFAADEKRLGDAVLQLRSTVSSVAGREQWLARAAQAARSSADAFDPGDPLARAFLQARRDAVEPLIAPLREVIALCEAYPQFIKHAQLAVQLYDIAQALLAAVDDLDASKAILEAPREPLDLKYRPKGDADVKASLDLLLLPVRDALRVDGDLAPLLRFDTRQWSEATRSCAASLSLLLELLDEFESRFTQLKRRMQALDFADLEQHAYALLADVDHAPSAAASSLHRRFRHVLVDEYQDVNPLQEAILRHASTDALALRDPGVASNLYCVGDVKQSIYGFRMAEPRQFVRRLTDLSAAGAGAAIPLQVNFRSRPSLLEAINALCRRLMTRATCGIDYDRTQALHARDDGFWQTHPNSFAGGPIELHIIRRESGQNDQEPAHDEEQFDAVEHEAKLIVDRIKSMLGQAGAPARMVLDEKAPGGFRPLRHADIAILVRSARHTAGAIAGILRRHGIPVYADDPSGFFDAVEVRELLALIDLLDNESLDVAMAAVLRSPAFGVADAELLLARLRAAQPASRSALHELVHDAAALPDDTGQRLRRFLDRVARWRGLTQQLPFHLALERIVEESGQIGHLRGLPDAGQRVANVRELLRLAANFAGFQQPSLSRFRRFVRDLMDKEDLGTPPADGVGEDVVRIMTVHKSKGLEFPVVFLAQLGRRFNAASREAPVVVHRDHGVAIAAFDAAKQVRYPSPARTVVEAAISRDLIAEELRLLYVALTRAKEQLVLVGYASKKALEEWPRVRVDASLPLPAQRVLDAGHMLAWVGPVATHDPVHFSLAIHGESELDPGGGGSDNDASPAALADHFARLAPLEQADPAHANAAARSLADTLIARIDHVYLFDLATRTPAARSVTAVARPKTSSTPSTIPPTHRETQPLRKPAFLDPARSPSALDVGSATHRALQFLDFSALASLESTQVQLDELLKDHYLTPAERAAIDPAVLVWFGSTSVCRTLARRDVKVYRELPLYFTRREPDAHAPADQVLVRGRMDVLAVATDLSPGGALLIDFKTDRIDAARLPARIDAYRPQLDAYAEHVARLLGVERIGSALVFLQARHVAMFGN